MYRVHRIASMPPALLRLEDIGPGGPYRTIDDLGRLRAVFEYLRSELVPFQIALIPRWINLEPDGSWYDKGIDALYPDEYLKKFVRLMQDTERAGALLGMHGYSHQYGDKRMEDDNQDTGVGYEFDVKGCPVTKTKAYAYDRITRSLMAFQKANLHPHFWETPHYSNTLEQEKIFESFSNVLYQPDVRGRATTHAFVSEANTVFIPTPLGYIHGQNTVDQVLSKLPAFRGLASMFYHPFLEFPYLEPVKNAAGIVTIRDGLPEYRYIPGEKSNLKRLVTGFREKGFRWVSLHEILP